MENHFVQDGEQFCSVRAISPENATNEVLDKKFVSIMLEIEKKYLVDDSKLHRHEKIRIEQWVSYFRD